MIHELREYTLDAGDANAYFDLFRDVGMPIRGDRYGRLVGNWTVDGEHVKFVHIWEYESLADRAAKRAALGQVKAWAQEFMPEAVRRVSTQFITILNPVGGVIQSAGVNHKPSADGRALYTFRCRLGTAPLVARAIGQGEGSKHDGIWVGEFPDPNTVYVLAADGALKGEGGHLDELGVVYMACRKISAGPHR